MKISVSQQQGRVPVTVFVVEGEITADTAGPLLDETRKAVAAGTTNLLLDLSAVPYIASFGIRALSDMLKLLHSNATDQSQADLRQALRDGRSKSRHLKLLNPAPHVRKVLEMSGLDLLFEAYEDEALALASF
jgi:anti-anti-sigma factor